jgi:hypothetical protein
MKYIMCESPMEDMFPVLFPEHVGHAMMRNAIHTTYPGIKIVSAGFCTSAGNVYGESVSLRLKSSPKDAYWIRKTLDVNVDDQSGEDCKSAIGNRDSL